MQAYKFLTSTRAIRSFLVAAFLGAAGMSSAALPLNTSEGWVALMHGVNGDPINDTQSNAADTDIVGDAAHGSLYTMFDDNGTTATADDSLMFRVRIGNPSKGPTFSGVAAVGMDANLDGKVDIYMVVDGRFDTFMLMDPGTEANNSPSTTSTSLIPYSWLKNYGIYLLNSTNYSVAGVSSGNDPHWNGKNDLDGDGKQDAFVTWRVPMADVATVLSKPSPVEKGVYGPRGTSGIAGYGKDTVVRYVNFTQTQYNTINGDLNGIGANYDDRATFAALKVFTAPMSAAKPVSASDKIAITKPVDADGYLNAAEDDAVVIKGTTTAGRWVKLTVSDTSAATADVIAWVQAANTGIWTTAGLDLSKLAEGTLTFTADLVLGSGSSVKVAGVTSDTATAIHDTGLALVKPTVAPLSTTNTTPTLTGTWGGGADTLTVAVNGVPYSVGSQLKVSGKDWALTLPAALTVGTYDVTATVKSVAGNVAIDTTTGELTITAPAPPPPPVVVNPPAPAPSTGTTPQSICFNPPTKVSRGTSLTLVANPSSGLPASFAVTSGTASLSGNVITFTTAGSVVVTASQAGDSTFEAAKDHPVTIEVVDFAVPTAIADGWTVTYGGEEDLAINRNTDAKAIAMQVKGNEAVTVAATGSTTSAAGDRQIYTAKYDAASGEKLWSVVHAGEAGCLDEGAAIAMDSAGNVWITGVVTNAAKNTDLYAAKYASADGALVWEQTFRGLDGVTDSGNDGPGGYQSATAYQGGDIRRGSIALAADGSVIITGYVTKTDKKMDAITLKYGPAGKLAWAQSFNGAANGTDYGHAVTLDAAGDVFVAGGSINANLDAVIVKYSGATGAQVWAKTYDGGKPDSAVAIKIDSDGHPVITGYSQRATFDFFAARFDKTDGSLIWRDVRDGPAKSSDMAWDFAFANGNQPIITGTSYPANGMFDGYTFRYACLCAGEPILWANRYNGAVNKQDQFVSIGTDKFDNPVVTGYSQNADGSFDTQTVKYAAETGAVLWQKRYNGAANKNDLPRQILVDPIGNVFVAGFTTSDTGVMTSWVTRYVAALPASNPEQAITFLKPSAQGVADTLVLNASASSGLPVKYEVVSGPAVIKDSTVTFTATGAVTLRASQPGNATYKAAQPVERGFTVGKSRQAIGLNLPASVTAAETFTLSPVATSGLPVTYTIVSGPAKITKGVLSFSEIGVMVITAEQKGDERFQAAPFITRTIQITKTAQTLVFTPPAKALDTDTLELKATTNSGLPVSYSVVSGPGLMVNGVLTFTDAGKVIVRAEQAGDALHAAAPAVDKTITVTCAKPVLDAIAFNPAQVSEEVSYRLTAKNRVTRFSATGLPPGVTLNATTGVISGRPTAVKTNKGVQEPYLVTLTASNGGGAGAPVKVSWQISALDAAAIGTFSGLIAPSETLSGLGGSISIVTTGNGSFTGKTVIDTLGYTFTGKLSLENGSAVITRANASSLNLTFKMDCASGGVTGVITDGTESAAFSAWRTAGAAVGKAQGIYNAALEIPADLQGQGAYPQGNGYGTLKVTATGAATWSGRLADGTAVTASTAVGVTGRIPLHIPLYAASGPATAGALNGWIILEPESRQVLAGSLRWKKNAQPESSATRNYKAGFAAHELTIIGDKYTGVLVNSASEGVASHEAMLTFSEGGIDCADCTKKTNGQLRQALRLVNQSQVAIPTTTAANPAKVKLTLNAATGLMSGTFTVADPSAPKATRTVSYMGVMLPRLNQGIGHFVAPLAQDGTASELSGQALLEVLK